MCVRTDTAVVTVTCVYKLTQYGDGYMYVQTDTAVVTVTCVYKLTQQW